MKLRILLLLTGIFSYLNVSLPQQISGRFSTSAYSWERFDTVGQSNVITRLFQNVLLNGSYGDISFSSHITGAVGGSGKLTDDAQVRVFNAYLRWKNIADVVEVNLGRIPVFAGVGNGTIDGALFKARILDDKITLSGYGGGNVPQNLRAKGFTDFDENFLIGGQVVGYFLNAGRFSVSYMNRQRSSDSYFALRPDSVFNAIQIEIQPETRKEQIIGTDMRYSADGKYSVYGRFDYDINSNHVLRGELDGRLDVMHNLSATGTFIYREPRIPFHTFFSLFDFEAITEYEGGVEYSFSPAISGFGRFAFVQYDDDDSRRYTVGVNTKYGSCSYSGSDGYSGQLNSFSVNGLYPFFDRLFTPTAAVSFSNYRLNKASHEENALAGSLGAIVRPLQSFSFDVQVQWIKNKIVNSDVRMFGRISYWFNHNFSQSPEKGSGK